MVCRLIGFAVVVLKLVMFKVCETTGISRIEFFNFFSIESVNAPVRPTKSAVFYGSLMHIPLKICLPPASEKFL